MLGAGHSESKRKFQAPDSAPNEYTTWIRLDINPDCHPDVLFNLDLIEKGKVLPFQSEYFDEIHAYEVLEHYGHQGDYKGFFTGMRELWRILKPNGLLIGTCPSWNKYWAWGDPGHTRIITEGTLSYLMKEMYEDLGKSPATDYSRFVSPCWWRVEFHEHIEESGGLRFACRKIKE